MGLGKTHLVQAIGNHVFQKNPERASATSTPSAMYPDVVRAYQHKAFDEFKRYYHHKASLDRRFFSFSSKNQKLLEFSTPSMR